MRARVVAVVMFLLVAGLVQPVLANDLGRILGGLALGYLTKESYKLSDGEIAQLGDQAAQEMRGQYEVYTDSRVSRVGKKLASQAGIVGVRFWVVKDAKEKNAFAIPSQPGSIYITSAYLAKLTNDDQLSFVLGHEVGHLAKRHASQNLRRAGERRGIIVGLLVATGANETWQEVGSGIDFFAGNHYSQKQELEADEFGYRLTARIGRNPSAGLAAFDKLREGSEPPRWLNSLFNSHPLLSDRQKRLAMQRNLHEQPAAQTSASTPTGPTVVVAIDPKAGESYGLAFGRGYYYAEDLSRVTQQEVEEALEKRGYTVLVSTQDVGPLQEELDLENSEWGQHGDNRNPKGYFSGAQATFYVSAYVLQESGFNIGDWQNQAQLSGLKIGVLLREIDLKTRKQSQTFRGSGSARALDRVRTTLSGYEIDLQWATNQARTAIQGAVGNALGGVSSYAAPTTAPSPPRASASKPAIQFVGVGREVRLGERPVTLQVSVPQGTAKVVFRVLDANNNQVLDGKDQTPPTFSVAIRPGMLRGLDEPLQLEAIAYNTKGRELGRTQVPLTLAQ